MEGEGSRVAPSRAKGAAAKKGGRAKKAARDADTGGDAQPSPATGRRRSKKPLIVIANSQDRDAALAGLERWKAKQADAAGHLAVDDVLIDSMRGRSSTWTRIRVNLRNVPEDIRPPQETPDPDDDPTREWREAVRRRPAEEG
jgi:hypothetical protein